MCPVSPANRNASSTLFSGMSQGFIILASAGSLEIKSQDSVEHVAPRRRKERKVVL
jgi:hypothetical protein